MKFKLIDSTNIRRGQNTNWPRRGRFIFLVFEITCDYDLEFVGLDSFRTDTGYIVAGTAEAFLQTAKQEHHDLDILRFFKYVGQCCRDRGECD